MRGDPRQRALDRIDPPHQVVDRTGGDRRRASGGCRGAGDLGLEILAVGAGKNLALERTDFGFQLLDPDIGIALGKGGGGKRGPDQSRTDQGQRDPET